MKNQPSLIKVALLFALCLLLTIPSFGQNKKKKKQKNTITSSQTIIPESLLESMEYRNLGPYRGGRSCAVAGVPNQPNLFYFGATGGGVWKTADGGRSWDNISDGFFGGSIGAIAVSEDDPNVIYVGGGEQTVRGNVSSGYGVWKSEDAGKTWKASGLSKSRHIARLRIHPRNHNIVFAAVMGDLYKGTQERGVYKSMDGGQTWKQVLFANADAGAVDLTFDPSNPRILFASTWNIRRTPYSLSSGGDGSALWKSTDGGDTWTNISENKGLPTGTLGIIGVTVSPLNSDRVWAIIENDKGGLFRSDDGGATWKLVNSERKLRQRAWYYTRVYADTENEDVVYVMNVSYHKSTDGGRTFKGSNAPHGDHHDLWIAPENANRMIIADDGGAQVSYDGGQTWSTYYNQPTAQFYRVTTDNHFPYRIYAAQQDNSTIRLNHRSSGGSISENDWEATAGCECGHIAIDPNDTDIVYGGCYDGFLGRLDHKTDQRRIVSVWPDNPMGYGAEGMKYRFQWNFPIFFSPHDSKKLYAASNVLHVSTNEGQSWEIISPDLTTNDPEKQKSSGGPITQDNTSVEYYCTIFAAVESPRVEGLIWTGSDDGLVHITRDGGKNWTNVTPSGMPSAMQINSIEADPFNDGGAYLAGTRYKSGDFAPYLYYTKDYGQTWKKITNGIDKEHFTRVVRTDPNREGLLYAGTETGAYVSIDNGQNWQRFQLNLPIVPITDMAVKNGNLVVATQGRSLWIVDDLSILYQYASSLKQSAVHLYQPMDSYRMNGFQGRPSKTAGANHPGGVTIHYFIKELAEDSEVKISIKNTDGSLIKAFSNKSKEKNAKLEAKTGANKFRWNMRYDNAKDFDGMILWWASLTGPKAVPGKYKVELMVDDVLQEQSFVILKDPRSTTSQSGYQSQFDFVKSVLDKTSEAHQTIIDIRDIRSQMNNYTDRLGEDEQYAALKDKAANIDSLMSVIEKTLYQTKNRSGQDPLNFPIRLTNKLAHLNSITSAGDYPPTDQAIAVKNELTAKIDEQIQAFEKVKSEELPKFNQMVRDLAVDVGGRW